VGIWVYCAEGCFFINIVKSNDIGVQVKLAFSISQHSRDELLFSKRDYLGCGNLEKPVTRSAVIFVVYKVISERKPFLQEYPIWGVKSLDYSDFSKVALLMKDKAHLTDKGLAQIRLIKLGMNKGRTDS